jgi:DNA mismatch repair protein MutS
LIIALKVDRSTMPKYTPMIEQYLAVKHDVPDALLFFRLGDFYEMFFDDALLASRELEITLTGREGGAEERIPMCGVPHHSAEGYIHRLIDKGYKVAVCEQVENPAEAKGVVRREIIRIVTPGTVMDSKGTGDKVNNYAVSLAQGQAGFGLAACDLSTGELYAAQLGHSLELLLDELNVYQPSELIGDEGLLERFGGIGAGWARRPVLSLRERGDDDLTRRQFPADELERLSDEAWSAVSTMIAYLAETQKRTLEHVRQIRFYEPGHYMTMDAFTRRNLELTETVRERTKQGSLLWLLDRTVTSPGGRRLRRWLEKPLLGRDKIEQRLEAVQALYSDLIVRDELRGFLKEVYDIERLAARIAYGSANARDLLALGHSLKQVPALKAACQALDSLWLASLVEQMDECKDVQEWISTAIADDPPVSVRDGGMIRPGYHEYLDKLREAGAGGKRWIAELEKQERELTGIKSLKVGFNKVFGYYIEVTRANVAALPEGRYERKQTLANAERYVTPELKEKEALILEAEEKMVGLEFELFTGLREKLVSQIPRLQGLADLIADTDALQSLAAVSAERRYCRPVITDGYDLEIVGGRHPVIESVLPAGEAFVANEVMLRDEAGRMLLITGPNMAGKSTYMRQSAIICLMAHIGCFVPADRATIPLIDRIFTRIGAADDLVGGQSTFMVEMRDIQTMTAQATKKSLVIIDELGRGTSTEEGMAIAQAVIEYLHHHIGCKTLVSTHYHELAHLEESLEHLSNGCMAVKESGGDVIFLRKLIAGAAGTSYGIHCARIAGLPESVIARAYELLSAAEGRTALATEAAGSGPAAVEAAAAVQLSLFGEETAEPPRPGGKSGSRAQRGAPPPATPEAAAAAEVAAAVKAADLFNMTPLAAMQFIHELKQKLQLI